jgi:hypothetical protein
VQKAPGKIDVSRGDKPIVLSSNHVMFKPFNESAQIYMYEVVIDGLLKEDPLTQRSIQNVGADE